MIVAPTAASFGEQNGPRSAAWAHYKAHNNPPGMRSDSYGYGGVLGQADALIAFRSASGFGIRTSSGGSIEDLLGSKRCRAL